MKLKSIISLFFSQAEGGNNPCKQGWVQGGRNCKEKQKTVFFSVPAFAFSLTCNYNYNYIYNVACYHTEKDIIIYCKRENWGWGNLVDLALSSLQQGPSLELRVFALFSLSLSQKVAHVMDQREKIKDAAVRN